jgi:NO-binding membrane sensor protein with MHYT domain
MTLESARKHLTRLWFIAFIVVFAEAVALASTDKYGSQWQERLLIISWFASWLVPTLSLMLTVTGNQQRASRPIKNVNLYYYCCTASLMLFLGLLAIPLFDAWTEMTPQDIQKFASFAYVPVQGVVMSLITKLFLGNA